MDKPAEKETAKKPLLNSKFSLSRKSIMGKFLLTLLQRSMIFPEVQSIIGEKN
ncbi:hypothetical protein SAMN05660477_03121 [Soonwooa buanensis]|uniref:Uncharacterized protein n=1 Tax=Soonwooa buanensis TaxID=619805 RepID=A0A1T5GT21_9FLAO|nr:hypothetical protein SAMN05660477_03121 [Soonwooa buanensis]